MGCGASSGPKTAEQIAQMAGKMWKQMDQDKSGHLTKDEIDTFFDHDAEVSEKLLKEVNTDGDGYVTEQEWKSYWVRLAQQQKAGDDSTEQWINKVDEKIAERKKKGKAKAEAKKKEKKEFRKKLALGKDLGLDANQDGQITKDELRAYLIKKNGECSDELLESTYVTLDKDADGNLTVADIQGSGMP